jgi:hypothetical protein
MSGAENEDDQQDHPGFTIAGGPEAGASSPSDFHTFLMSLSMSVLYHLGEIEGPDGRPGQVELSVAKETIDVIAMLQEKTRGNLTPPEEHLILNLLADLRLRYVEKSKAGSASPG